MLQLFPLVIARLHLYWERLPKGQGRPDALGGVWCWQGSSMRSFATSMSVMTQSLTLADFSVGHEEWWQSKWWTFIYCFLRSQALSLVYCFSNSDVHMNHLEIFPKSRFRLCWSGWALRCYISSKISSLWTARWMKRSRHMLLKFEACPHLQQWNLSHVIYFIELSHILTQILHIQALGSAPGAQWELAEWERLLLLISHQNLLQA